jgi:hypothetical protein
MIIAEFIDLLGKTDIIDGQIWLEEWQNEPENKYQEIKNSLLTREFILKFAQTITSQISSIPLWLRLSSVYTYALYKSILKRGHDFLREICEKANEYGIKVSLNEIDTCLTPTEVMQSEGLISVDEKGDVDLTEKGKEVARETQFQLEE